MTLYKSGEDYLKAILVLTNRNGFVRSIDVAKYLKVTKPSVSRAMRLLQEGQFLSMDEKKRVYLTELGREIAEGMYERNRILTKGLIAIGVDPETAEQDACKIEHDLSNATFEKLKAHWEMLVSNSGII
ncbi:MAG: metal-dependent transcriptional regulator [Oscillospiraceae bacterium]|nr:metal-dependent transcriptional regulator [Oscillospiraceae bacterium]